MRKFVSFLSLFLLLVFLTACSQRSDDRVPVSDNDLSLDEDFAELDTLEAELNASEVESLDEDLNLEDL